MFILLWSFCGNQNVMLFWFKELLCSVPDADWSEKSTNSAGSVAGFWGLVVAVATDVALCSIWSMIPTWLASYIDTQTQLQFTVPIDNSNFTHKYCH